MLRVSKQIRACVLEANIAVWLMPRRNFELLFVPMLRRFLSTNASKLTITRLDLGNVLKHPESWQAISIVLPKCTSLLHLDLRANFIGEPRSTALELLAKMLPGLPLLEHLDLRQNPLGAAGMQTLAEVLSQGPPNPLQHLNVSCSDLTTAGAKPLAALLLNCASLQHLDVAANDLKELGVRRLAAVLPLLSSLISLDLYMNALGDDGARALAKVLPQCTSLAHLMLGGNMIENEGAETVAAVLSQCAALAHLDLSYNAIKDAEMLAGVLPLCTSLVSLNLRGNKINQEQAQRMKRVLTST